MTRTKIVTPPLPTMTPIDDSGGTPRTTIQSSFEPLQTNNSRRCIDLIFSSCFPLEARPTAQRLLAGLGPELSQQLLDEVAENHLLDPTKTIPLRLLRYLSSAARNGRFAPELCFQAAARRRLANQVFLVEKNKSPSASLTREQISAHLSTLRQVIGAKNDSR